MKKLLFFVLSTLISFSSFSQQEKEGWKKSLGIMVVPQGGIDLKKTDKGFSNQSNVFMIASFSKDKNSFTPFYSVTNAIGMAYSRSFSENYGGYLVANKNVLNKNNYIGVGLTRFVNKASVFIEFGTSFNEFTPGIYAGVFIPFTFSIDKKR